MGRRLGLVIGINACQDTTLRPLQYAETDARALAQWLVHARGGQWHPADVQVVLGREATRELLETLISQLCLQQATSEDLVFLYFAGHTFVDQASGDGYLACSNTVVQQPQSGLHLLSLVSQVMARSSAAQILCILDCFQNGPAWRMRRSVPFDFKPLFGPTLLNGLQQTPGRLFYCSCRGHETAPEVSEKQLGSFMYRFIMGANGPALNTGNGELTLQNLHDFLHEQLREQHRPQIFGQERRPVVLVGELPAFQPGALFGNLSGGLPSLASSPGTAPMGQAAGLAASTLAQLSPSTSAIGQQRRNQCQQMLQQARQMVGMNNLQQAYQLIEMILQMDATLVEALILKGQILGTIGQFQEALNVAQHIVQLDPNNALGWSMAASLLANLGQYNEAMSAVDRSLSIDPINSETIAMKEMIREKLAEEQFDTGRRSRLLAPASRPRDTALSFWLGMGTQLGALGVGMIGAFLELLAPSLPKLVAILLTSVALALLIVNAWRGAYLYGAKRLIGTFLGSLVAALVLVLFTSGLVSTRLAVKPAYAFIVNHVSGSLSLLTPLVYLIFWLAAAAALPLLAGLIGGIVGALVRGRRRSEGGS